MNFWTTDSESEENSEPDWLKKLVSKIFSIFGLHPNPGYTLKITYEWQACLVDDLSEKQRRIPNENVLQAPYIKS